MYTHMSKKCVAIIPPKLNKIETKSFRLQLNLIAQLRVMNKLKKVICQPKTGQLQREAPSLGPIANPDAPQTLNSSLKKPVYRRQKASLSNNFWLEMKSL